MTADIDPRHAEAVGRAAISAHYDPDQPIDAEEWAEMMADDDFAARVRRAGADAITAYRAALERDGFVIVHVPPRHTVMMARDPNQPEVGAMVAAAKETP